MGMHAPLQRLVMESAFDNLDNLLIYLRGPAQGSCCRILIDFPLMCSCGSSEGRRYQGWGCMQGMSTCTASLGFSRAKQRMPMLSCASGICRKPSEAAAASCTCAPGMQPLRHLRSTRRPHPASYSVPPMCRCELYDVCNAEAPREYRIGCIQTRATDTA